jgi:hypothetical protein
MIKLLDLLREEKLDILKPRRSPEERQQNFAIATQKKIEQYMKDGGKGGLYLVNTPISKKYSKEEIKKMVPGVKGNIYT